MKNHNKTLKHHFSRDPNFFLAHPEQTQNKRKSLKQPLLTQTIHTF